MNLEDAISRACSDVGIIPPAVPVAGRWMKTGTLSGRNGKGDGRLMINEACVTSFNWQTGEKSTVWLKDETSPEVKRQVRQDVEKQEAERKKKAETAARVASLLVAKASMREHPYLAAKGFPQEPALVVEATDVLSIGGKYLVPEGSQSAIVMPARKGNIVSSVQLIWESGEKKFLAGGETMGTSHRIATGRDTWLCEGLATGLSLRAVLKSLRHSATILCCFSASNLEKVSANIQGRAYIAADNDKHITQFDGLGAGEFYAKRSGLPYFMPPSIGEDFNDMHQRDGIFAAQRLICDFLKGAKR